MNPLTSPVAWSAAARPPHPPHLFISRSSGHTTAIATRIARSEGAAERPLRGGDGWLAAPLLRDPDIDTAVASATIRALVRRDRPILTIAEGRDPERVHTLRDQPRADRRGALAGKDYGPLDLPPLPCEGTPAKAALEALVTSLLTFVAMGILLVGCVGVANAVSAYLERKRDTIAILKSLGARSPGISASDPVDASPLQFQALDLVLGHLRSAHFSSRWVD